MTDTISRKQAIDAVARVMVIKSRGGRGNQIAEAVDSAKIIIADNILHLPPIQPKRGKWILDRSGAYRCSECMEPCAGYVMMKPRDRFCKMCGSRNEVTT